MKREVKSLISAARRGLWRFCWFMIANWAYGLTHRRCATCGYQKGRSPHRLCPRCQLRNLNIGLMCDMCGCSLTIVSPECSCSCHIEEQEEASAK